MIGVSKEACFLCDSFIRAHGWFSVSGAHRQMFPGWTLPDLEDYTPQSVVRIRTALLKVCEEVQEEFLRSQKQHTKRPFPLQSAINLNVIRLKTPSASTLPTRDHSSNDDDAAGSDIALRTSDWPDPVVIQGAVAGCSSGNEIPSASHHIVTTDKQQSNLSVPVDLMIDKSAPDYTTWLDLSATCSISAIAEVLHLYWFANFSINATNLWPDPPACHK